MSQWDKKAKNYSRYSEDKNSFDKKIFKALESLHVKLTNKTLLDIGCGTGVYTLQAAKQCLHVKAIDSSKEMLEVLKQDAKTLNLTNIETLHVSWDEFTCKESYDYALCTMSPALRDEKDFIKMDNCATTKIYLGWAGKRDSNILDLLFKAHGQIYTAPNGSKKLQNWLDKNKRFYHLIPFEETKISKRDLKKSIENFQWHLEIRGIVPNINKIEEILKKLCDENDNITETTESYFNLIIW
ncbi:class I SAM-dependent methyltransferase [Sulfurospirillum arcachonense]|uniref:class I SAM-dependent methyltransferase n=1 Tax=Sulfurospirillum arcachonense TaxID=57666 RepID=UPI00046A4B1E|nr:class I SAM-dependent methyltransferase [Sulfurospirillum arcachonense]